MPRPSSGRAPSLFTYHDKYSDTAGFASPQGSVAFLTWLTLPERRQSDGTLSLDGSIYEDVGRVFYRADNFVEVCLGRNKSRLYVRSALGTELQLPWDSSPVT